MTPKGVNESVARVIGEAVDDAIVIGFYSPNPTTGTNKPYIRYNVQHIATDASEFGENDQYQNIRIIVTVNAVRENPERVYVLAEDVRKALAGYRDDELSVETGTFVSDADVPTGDLATMRVEFPASYLQEA